MIKKSLLLVGFVSACSLALAATKSYDVLIEQPAVAGAAKLAPGEYKLTVENGTATFTNVRTKATVSAPVKLETAKRKYERTALEAATEGKTERVEAVELGGSTTKVEFGNAAHSGM
jgi:hypothetical protein